MRKYSTLSSPNTSDDELLFGLLYNASRSIDHFTRRHFYPLYGTRFYNYEESRQIRVDEDLLRLAILRTQNGACTVASSVMWLAAGDNWNRFPYDRIVLSANSGSVLNYSGTPQRANEVTGVWGYHEDYENAWIDTGTSLAAAYTASAGSMSLAGAGSYGVGASDALGQAPRIAPGDLLKMGDQFFAVTGGTTSGNGTALIVPFVNGTSTAGSPTGDWVSGTSIAKFAYEPDIVWATKRLTAWIYGQKDSPFFQRQAAFNLGVLEIPEQWPVDVKERLQRFVKRDIQIFPARW